MPLLFNVFSENNLQDHTGKALKHGTAGPGLMIISLASNLNPSPAKALISVTPSAYFSRHWPWPGAVIERADLQPSTVVVVFFSFGLVL